MKQRRGSGEEGGRRDLITDWRGRSVTASRNYYFFNNTAQRHMTAHCWSVIFPFCLPRSSYFHRQHVTG